MSMQYRYGSRFFLPNRWRTKVYEFRRDIAVDFLCDQNHTSYKAVGSSISSKLDCAECDFCFEKLYFTSLLARDKSLSSIEGKECYSIYMKSKDGFKYHYFCLEYMIANGYFSDNQCRHIDSFDD